MIEKRVLSRDADRWLLCCWDECTNQGVELHKTRFHDHNPGTPCQHPDSSHLWYVFCSERHRQYFLHSHRSNGNLPAGHRLTLV